MIGDVIMRIIKEAEVRRNEILDAADELFSQKGFDNTSTNDILEKVGIARGTLYYHFKSKEDIMNALIERYTIRILNSAKKIAEDKSISINERLVKVVLALNVSHKGGIELKDQMHKPQNALMHQKTQAILLNNIIPILTDLIKEGPFQTPFPRECIEMIMSYTTIFFDDDMTTTHEEQIKRIKALSFNIERLLGVESGSMTHYITQMFGFC